MLAQEVESSRIGVTAQEAEDIAVGNAIRIGLSSVVVFYLIYRFLIK